MGNVFYIFSYVPWNLHEPVQGKYNFNGIANLTQFLTLANKTGLLVIARLGPYICGEWDMVRRFFIIRQQKQTNKQLFGCTPLTNLILEADPIFLFFLYKIHNKKTKDTKMLKIVKKKKKVLCIYTYFHVAVKPCINVY